MKIKSVSGLTYYVKDLKKTAKFYETLGFDLKNKDTDYITAYMNWFFIYFLLISKEKNPEFKKESRKANKGAGMYIYMSVDDVDAFYKYLKSKKIKPSTEPRDWPWGNREFVVKDPDGYKIVIFKKIK